MKFEIVKRNDLIADIYINEEKVGHIEKAINGYDLEINYKRTFMPKKDYNYKNLKKFYIAGYKHKNREVLDVYRAYKRGFSIIG